jgi:hypothetical protein
VLDVFYTFIFDINIVGWTATKCHFILTLHPVNSDKGQADGRRSVRGASAKHSSPSAVQARRRHLGMHMTRIVLVEVVQNPVTRCFSHNQISSHAVHHVLSERPTHHMCEKPSNPSSACSGLVNTELKRASLP